MPQLTICIPTYNRARFLRTTLNHLLKQIRDWTSVQVLISDNASTDETHSVVESFRKVHPALSYQCNERNLGMDENAFRAIEAAAGTYVWLLSDDDIPLPGVFDEIMKNIAGANAGLLYLHVAGYWPGEPYDIVYGRTTVRPDKTYLDPEEALRELEITHFSAIIMKRSLALPHIPTVRGYAEKGFTRGYTVNVAHYVLLSSRKPCIFIGKLALACHNPQDGNNYNVLTTLIDSAREYQILRSHNLVSARTEHTVLNALVRGFYILVIPRRCNMDPHASPEVLAEITRLYRPYRNYWLFLHPFVALPLWALRPLYLTARTARRLIRSLSQTLRQGGA